MKENMKKTFINLSVLLVTITGAFLLMETVLRFTDYSYILNPGYYSHYHVADPEAGFDLAKNFPEKRQRMSGFSYDVWTNGLGCFDYEYEGEGGYILAVGDSYTWGFAPLDDKWTKTIEYLTDIRALSCGVVGYGMMQSYLKAKKVVKETEGKPSVIVAGYYIGNDLADDSAFPNNTVVNGRLVWQTRKKEFINTEGKKDFKKVTVDRKKLEEKYKIWAKYCSDDMPKNPVVSRAMCFLRRNSIIFAMLYQVGGKNAFVRELFGRGKADFNQKTTGSRFIDPEEHAGVEKAWLQQKEAFMKFKKLAEQNDAEFFVAIIPEKVEVYNFLWGKETYPEEKYDFAHQVLGNMLKELDIKHVDLMEVFRRSADLTPRERLDHDTDLYWPYDGHWNIKGNKLGGLIIAKELVSHGFITLSSEEKKNMQEKVESLEKKYGFDID